MSDLHDAVRAEIGAYRPSAVPPFDARLRRRKTRDRRRLAIGAAALSAVAVATAAVLAPPIGGRPDELPGYTASPGPTPVAGDAGTASFTVHHLDRGVVDPGTDGRLDACLALPGVRHASKATTPPVHGVTVDGTREAEAFASCVRGLAGDGVVLTEHRPPALATAADIAAFVESCAWGRTATPVSGFLGMTQQEVLSPDVNSRILGRDGVCNPGSPVPDPSIVDVVIADGVVVWAGHLTPPQEPDASLPVPPQDPAGAELCKDSGDGGECFDLGPAQAAELAAALATGRPAPNAPECAVAAAVYRVTWWPASGLLDPVVWTVPSAACQLMTVADTKYDLDQDAHDLVAQVWDTARLDPVQR